MKLALGPVPYYWTRATLEAFYDAIADAPVDTVYLGEQVCSRRHEMDLDGWMRIGDALRARGKEVVLSTQALLESEGDLKLLRRIAGNCRFRVEANDMSAVRLLQGRTGWVAGPHLNVYNPRTLALLAGLGATRWVAPVEITQEALRGVQSERPPGVETEVFAYGRLPLAFSARCFTARRFNLQKEDCGFRCIEFPDGLDLRSGEGEPFLVLNGVQTESSRVYWLLHQLPALADAGVGVLRISPHASYTVRAIEVLRACCDGAMDPQAALDEMRPLMPDSPCDGFWHGRPGLELAFMGAAR